MQRERITEARILALCADCGRYSNSPLIHGVAPSCNHCGSFEVAPLRVVRVAEDMRR